jgi:omega-amidase
MVRPPIIPETRSGGPDQGPIFWARPWPDDEDQAALPFDAAGTPSRASLPAMAFGVVLAQIQVGWSVEDNEEAIATTLSAASPGDVILTPEGSLSGYPSRGEVEAPRLEAIDHGEVEAALERLASSARAANVTLWIGACRPAGAKLANEAIGVRPDGTRVVYRKANLGSVERGRFAPGDQLPIFDVGGGRVALQLCREVRFSEQWLTLAGRGAAVFLHPDNGIGPGWSFDVWRSLLVARAHETQRFVVSANAAHPDQHAPSLVVAPTGEIIDELPPGATAIRRFELDLSAIEGTYLAQRRRDLADGAPSPARP